MQYSKPDEAAAPYQAAPMPAPAPAPAPMGEIANYQAEPPAYAAYGIEADAMPPSDMAAYANQAAAQVPQPPQAPREPLMTDTGEFAPGWYRRFEELKDYAPTLAKFRRPEALAKSYAALERMKGYPGIENVKQMDSFRRSVGLPENALDYQIKRPDNTPNEFWDDGFVKSISEMAYEYGVPAPAMDALAEHYCRENLHMAEKLKQTEQEAIARADSDLQRAWGMQYDVNMSTIGQVLETLSERAGVNAMALAENPALRASTDFAKLLLQVADMMQESPMRVGSPSNAQEEAHRIAHDPTHPLHEAYMRTSHPQHRYANEQYDRFAFGRRF